MDIFDLAKLNKLPWLPRVCGIQNKHLNEANKDFPNPLSAWVSDPGRPLFSRSLTPTARPSTSLHLWTPALCSHCPTSTSSSTRLLLTSHCPALQDSLWKGCRGLYSPQSPPSPCRFVNSARSPHLNPLYFIHSSPRAKCVLRAGIISLASLCPCAQHFW